VTYVSEPAMLKQAASARGQSDGKRRQAQRAGGQGVGRQLVGQGRQARGETRRRQGGGHRRSDADPEQRAAAGASAPRCGQQAVLRPRAARFYAVGEPARHPRRLQDRRP